MAYTVKRASGPVALDGSFEYDPQWKNAEIIRLEQLYTSEETRKGDDAFTSDVRLKLMYDEKNIYGLFQVGDKYVRAVSKGYPEQTCDDSCAEIFIRPMNNLRYYNFEFSANGNLLMYNITNLRAGNFIPIPVEEYANIKRYHSLPCIVEPEITENVTWKIGFSIPIDFFVRFGDNVNPALSGQVWTANVTKCADQTSNPHWLSWMKLPVCDFHLPESFGELIFE